MRLFDLSLQLNGFDIKGAKAQLRKIQNLESEERAHAIIKKRNDIVDYHLNHTAFFKDRLGKIYNGDWSSIPIMTKTDLQQPLDQRLSSGYNSKNVYINKTSGSSGNPFIFAKDKWCHAMTWAVIMDRFQWYGLDFNSSKQARFYGIPRNFLGYNKERLKDWLVKRYRFSVFDLSDTAFEGHLKKFKTKRFDYINGYTSPIVQFAKFLKRRGIVLTEICPTLKVCMVTSEMLFKEDRILLEDYIGVPVVNEYGASELDLIAFENPSGEWQLNNETLFIEIVDEAGNNLPNGEDGRVVITSLYNKAHPFIRYDIGDIGVKNKNSTLVKPLLESLVGRTNDLIKLPSGKTAAGLTFYYITKSIIEESGNVKEFVIEQLDLYTFKVLYVSERELSIENERRIYSEIIRYLEPDLKISFNRVTALKRSQSGKLKQFTSRI